MAEYAILDDGDNVVPVNDVMAWTRWFEANRDRKRVRATEVRGATVSTVFIGLNHSWGDGAPLWFETLVIGGDMDGEMQRYTTWAQAEAGHIAMVDRVSAHP